ncbi:hypothetical protein [Chelativorans sp. YIM 93263]|uniref:hypothetical protein n=1 Tax=Chelativorans sp. YIM 93263 TaxID=2906648 RepID=UPI00237816EB|nr:hypothetical protein [Chelativorans sp. YIM 93263]
MTDGEQLLDELVQSVGEAMKTIPDSMREETGPFAPPPWPREQMTVMYRFLNTDAGLPQRCSESRCRRTGQCHGGLGTEDCSSCAELGDDALAGRVMAAVLALKIAWVYEAQRKHALTNWLTGRPFSEGDPFEETARL